VVHVIHAADGMIPSDMATGESESVEEERRLLYVALTRARDALYVYFPLRSYRRPRGRSDDHAYSQLTRFLPEQVRGLLQQRSSALASMPSALAGSSSGPDGYLRDLWD
jgi:DNA helicase-2/ATP-dependent DNA helicase PcrA